MNIYQAIIEVKAANEEEARQLAREKVIAGGIVLVEEVESNVCEEHGCDSVQHEYGYCTRHTEERLPEDQRQFNRMAGQIERTRILNEARRKRKEEKLTP